MSTTIEKLNEYTYLVSTYKQEDLWKIFLRFQEHYESPEFKDKYFTLEEFKEYYKLRNKDNKFTYYEDWSGANIPSSVLAPFYSGHFDPLAEEEKFLLSYFSGIKDKFYIIGVCGKKRKALEHELVHALYYYNDKYRELVKETLNSYDISDIIDKIKEDGYNESVLLDEVNAYLVEKEGYLRFKAKNIDLVSKLRNLYTEYK